MKAARELYFARGADLIVACGGRSWNGRVEADEIAQQLRDGGVPERAIVRERCSLDTYDNARFAAALLGRRGRDEVVVLTCTWHLPRAVVLFRATGLTVEGVGVEPPTATRSERAYRRVREALATWMDTRRSVRPA